jgi:hypothetical protein
LASMPARQGRTGPAQCALSASARGGAHQSEASVMGPRAGQAGRGQGATLADPDCWPGRFAPLRLAVEVGYGRVRQEAQPRKGGRPARRGQSPRPSASPWRREPRGRSKDRRPPAASPSRHRPVRGRRFVRDGHPRARALRFAGQAGQVGRGRRESRDPGGVGGQHVPSRNNPDGRTGQHHCSRT